MCSFSFRGFGLFRARAGGGGGLVYARTDGAREVVVITRRLQAEARRGLWRRGCLARLVIQPCVGHVVFSFYSVVCLFVCLLYVAGAVVALSVLDFSSVSCVCWWAAGVGSRVVWWGCAVEERVRVCSVEERV